MAPNHPRGAIMKGGVVRRNHDYRQEVRPFTDNQIALVETFADQAAIAIENVRLLRGTAREN